MKLSIIIITKNEEKYLEKFLKSIKAQKVNFNYEIIVSDAFSKDKTRDIAKKYWCKIVDWWLPAVWRNNGAKIAKWKWLLFLDADSLLEKDSLQLWIDKLESKKKNVWTPFVKLREDEKWILNDLYFRWSLISYTLFWAVFGCCILCKKQIFDKVWWFNEKSYLWEDIDLIYKLKKTWRRWNLLPFVQTSWRRLNRMWVLKTIFLSVKLGIKIYFWKVIKKDKKVEKIYKL